jgi:signal transduction histidine kinase
VSTDAAGSGHDMSQLALRVLELCDPVYMAASDGTILYANDAYYRNFRRSDGGMIRRLSPRLLSVLRRGDGVVRQKEVVKVDGRERTLSGRHVRIVDESNNGSVLIGIYTDQTVEEELRTALKTSKERSDELLATIADWVWQTDSDWTVVHSVTRSATAGDCEESSILGHSLLKVGRFEMETGQLSGQSARRPRPPTHRTRAPFRDVPYVLPGSNGDDRYYLLSGIPIFDTVTGAFEGFRGSGTDVTGRIAAESRAHSYRRELEHALEDLTGTNRRLDVALSQATEADRAKSRFLGMIGHELRTPLNAIIGFSEIMNAELFGPLGNAEYKEYTGDVLQSGRHLLAVINDILDTVKLEAGEMTLHKTRFDPTATIDATLRLVLLQAEAKRISFVRNLPDNIPWIEADEQKVRQMLLNLLSNAIKFSPNGSRIDVDADRWHDGRFALSVRDNGIGIDSLKLESILLPFKQADDRISRSFEGTGLGLPLTQALIKLHGGELIIKSEPGIGTTVSIVFPADSAEPASILHGTL